MDETDVEWRRLSSPNVDIRGEGREAQPVNLDVVFPFGQAHE